MDEYTHGNLMIALRTNSKSSAVQRFGESGQNVISKPIWLILHGPVFFALGVYDRTNHVVLILILL